MGEAPIPLVFPSRKALRAACSFDKGRAVVRAPWNADPLVMGRPARLVVRVVGEGSFQPLYLDTVRTGPGRDGTQWFLVYGQAADLLARAAYSANGSPGTDNTHPAGPPTPVESAARHYPVTGTHRAAPKHFQPPSRFPSDPPPMSKLMAREVGRPTRLETAQASRDPRWRCRIAAMLEVEGLGEPCVIVDVSQSGARLVDLSRLPKVGERARLLVRGSPGEGLILHARVVRVEEDRGAAAVRFIHKTPEDAQEAAAWLAEVQAAVLSEGMRAGYLNPASLEDDAQDRAA